MSALPPEQALPQRTSPPAPRASVEVRPAAPKPVMLCVDDEPRVLEGLALILRRRFDLRTAGGGAEALALLDGGLRPAVIMSDMRMPGMSGAAFLAVARDKTPDSVRLLLTGQADMDSAISAVNDGQIFRFLTKPCPPPALMAAALAAAEQHRLITAEKELLEQTLLGSIKALTDILALSSPQLFGRATRLRKLAQELAAAAGRALCWQLDVACMLSQIGSVALPPAVAAKLSSGRPLEDNEIEMVERARALSTRLVSNIPRLEPVTALMDGMRTPWAKLTHATLDPDPELARDAQLLRAVAAFDAHESAGLAAAQAIEAMQADPGQFDPEAIRAIHALRVAAATQAVQSLQLHQLEAGMVFAEDVRLSNGVLLVSRGYEITDGLLARLDNFGDALVDLRFKVLAPA